MFTPRFSKDSFKLPFALEDIDRYRFRIERMLIMPKHEQWLRREAFVRAAYSSTMIENPTISEQEVEAAVKAVPALGIAKGRQDVANYARALELVDFLSDAEFVIDEAVICQIHWFLMRGIEDTGLKSGRYRTEPNWIEDQGVKVYESPFHVDVPMLMREFSLWLREDEDTHPVLKAGIAHAHLVAVHPFVDGNGRTARLLATLLLQRYGYGFRKLLSLDAFYQRNRDQYIHVLRQSIGKTFTADYDLTPWLEFFADSVIVQAMWLEGRLTDWRMMVEELHNELRPYGLSERQVDGLIYAARVGYIARKDYIDITNISPLTATRDLAQMAEKGLLMPEGAGRNRKYRFVRRSEPSEETKQRKLL